MQKFQNNIQDQFGNEIRLPTITVKNVVGGALSTLFSDDGVTPLANPFIAQDLSEFFFYAANNRYDIFITGPVTDSSLDILLFDFADGGGGTVTKVGTPVDNQIGVWTGDGTIEGDASFTWDGIVLNVGGAFNANGVATFIDDVQFKNGGDIEIFDASNTVRALLSTSLGPPDTFRISGAGQLEFFDIRSFNTAMRLRDGIVLSMEEIVAAPADAVGFGQFWVRDDAPNTPMFTRDDGTDVELDAGGGGNVTKVGTPADNQIGVWTGDGTIEGDSLLTWTGTVFEVDGTIQVSNASGPALLNEVSSNTNPTLIPNGGDPTSGLGGISGQPSLIAGGLSCMSVSESAGARQIGFYDRSPIAKQTGVAVTTSALHAALVSLGLIAA